MKQILRNREYLTLTFSDKNDYNKIRKMINLILLVLNGFAPGKPVKVMMNHSDGKSETITAKHSYNDAQIEWFKAGVH